MIEVHRLHLTDVTPDPKLPWTRPTFPVFAYLILDPTGPVLIDTGVGIGNELLDALYSPIHHDLSQALAAHGVAIADVETVVCSHLHFDHCGQNDRFGHAEVFAQRVEADAAREPNYTVQEWAFPPGVEPTEIEGDHRITPAVRILATPGHTPGHQSVLVDDGHDHRTIVCCQAAWDAASFGSAVLGDDGWDQSIGAASLERLHLLQPDRVLMSHDANDWLRDTGNPNGHQRSGGAAGTEPI